MPKKRLIKIAEEQEVEFDEALKIATEKLPSGSVTGKGRNTWVTEEGAKILEDSFMIAEIIPKHFTDTWTWRAWTRAGMVIFFNEHGNVTLKARPSMDSWGLGRVGPGFRDRPRVRCGALEAAKKFCISAHSTSVFG